MTTAEQFAIEAIRRACDRCDEGHAAYREHGEWVHGVDQREGIYLYPEPCPASLLHDQLSEIEQFQGRTMRQIEPMEQR